MLRLKHVVEYLDNMTTIVRLCRRRNVRLTHLLESAGIIECTAGLPAEYLGVFLPFWRRLNAASHGEVRGAICVGSAAWRRAVVGPQGDFVATRAQA